MSSRPVVYLAQAMSGRKWGEVVAEALRAVEMLDGHALGSWSPALKEAANTDKHTVVGGSYRNLLVNWKEDFKALKRSDAVLSLRGDIVSDGVGFELGLARYKFKIPVVIIAPKKLAKVTHVEADAVVPSLEKACRWLSKRLK